jgi:hypothetical protein
LAVGSFSVTSDRPCAVRFDLFEDVTHIEQISNPYFGRLVCRHESVEKSESVPRVTKAVLIGARSEVEESKTCWE